MKILVLGGTQFVSKRIGQKMSEKYNTSILTRGELPVDYEVKHLIGERTDVDFLESLDAYDVVIDVSGYTEDEIKLTADHLKYEQYIFISSGAVYTDTRDYMETDNERGLNKNWGQYGLDKLKAELYLESTGKNYTFFRPSYIYGQGNNLHRETYFFDRILADKIVPIPEGDNAICFIHIDDLVSMIDSSLLNEKAYKKGFNATNDTAYTFKDMLKVYENVLGREVKYIEVPKALQDKMNLQTRQYFPYRNVQYLMSIKALDEAGLKRPTYDLEEGLRLSLDYQKIHECKDVRMDQMDKVIEAVNDTH